MVFFDFFFLLFSLFSNFLLIDLLKLQLWQNVEKKVCAEEHFFGFRRHCCANCCSVAAVKRQINDVLAHFFIHHTRTYDIVVGSHALIDTQTKLASSFSPFSTMYGVVLFDGSFGCYFGANYKHNQSDSHCQRGEMNKYENFNYANDYFERRKRQQQHQQQHWNQTNQTNVILINESCFAVLPSFQRPFV